jgi:hypothetical protein
MLILELTGIFVLENSCMPNQGRSLLSKIKLQSLIQAVTMSNPSQTTKLIQLRHK